MFIMYGEREGRGGGVFETCWNAQGMKGKCPESFGEFEMVSRFGY